MQFLTSVTAKDIDDSFNPFKMKEKWMKFFKGNYQKVVCDNDRVLKNTMNHNMVEFMQDEMHKFNDTQLIRCLLVLSQAHSSKHGRLKDKCINLLINNVMEGKF
jgi:hypothetical protein